MSSRKIEADVVVKVTGADDIEAVAEDVKALADQTTNVRVEVEGEEQVKRLREEFKDLDNVTVTATAKVANQNTFDTFMKNVRGLDGETATAVLLVRDAQAQAALKEVIATIADVNSTPAEIQVATGKVEGLQTEIHAVEAEMRRLGEIPVTVNTEGAQEGLRKVGSSASDAGQVVSSAVGNATQDLAGLAGVSGTAGQAVGQMAENFIQAASGAGGLAAGLSSIMAAAAPIIGIAAVIGIVTTLLGDQAAAAQESADRTKAFGEAMSGVGDDALGFANVLRDNESSLRDFAAASNDNLGDVGIAVDSLMERIPLIGGVFDRTSVDVIAAMNAAGLSVYDFSSALADNVGGMATFISKLQEARNAGKIGEAQFNAIKEAATEYNAEVQKAAETQELWNVNQQEANAIVQAAKDPLTQYTDQWKILTDDLKDGEVNTTAAADAMNTLANKLGLTREQVADMALDKLADDEKAAADAAEAQAKAQEQAAEALAKYSIKVMEAQGALDELTSAFSLMESRGDALQSIFDLGNAPLDLLGEVQDVQQGIRDFAEFVSKDLKGKIPNIFNPDDVNADDFLAKIQSLRDPIQEQIAAAFASGGPVAAQGVADNYVSEIVAALGGKLTAEQVRSLLNLGDLQATIDIAVNQSKLDVAKRSLAILVGLEGQSPWTASIELALQAGTITPETAQILINQRLGGAGVEVPSVLGVPDAGQATVAAAIWARDHPVVLETGANSEGATTALEALTTSPWETTVAIDGDKKGADSKIEEVDSKAKSTKPEIAIGASIREAITTMLIINAIAKAMAPVVTVGANTFPAIGAVAAAVSIINSMHARVAVDAYIRNTPTAQSIANSIGVVRVPVDAYLRSEPRITGAR